MKEYKLDDITIVVDCEHKTAPIVSNSDFYSNKTFMKILANQTQIRTLTAFRYFVAELDIWRGKGGNVKRKQLNYGKN